MNARLIFPQTFTASDAHSSLTNLVATVRSAPLVFEIHAEGRDVIHRVSTIDSRDLRRRVRLAAPTLRVEIPTSSPSPVDWSRAIEVGLTDRERSLHAGNDAGSATALLSAVSGLSSDESLLLQWIVRPARGLPPERRRPAGDRVGEPVDRSAERCRKQSGSLVAAVGRIAVQAENRQRQQILLATVFGALRTASRSGVTIRKRLLPQRLVTSRVVRQTVPWFEWPLLLNVDELAGLLGWPIDVGAVPGLERGAARVASPSRSIPQRGAIVALANDGSERPIAMRASDRLEHTSVIGPTGSGKSHLLAQLLLQDIADGRGVVLIDPKGDLVDDVLARLDPARADDVIVFDPTDDDRPVGMNLLAHRPEERELIVESVASVMHQLNRAFWGPRTDDILRAGLNTLTAVDPTFTLVELPPLLSDGSFRRSVLKRLGGHEDLKDYWRWFESLSDGEQAQATAPLLNKVRAITGRPRLARVVGQSTGIDLADVIGHKRILLVRLNTGLLGRDAAQLLGSLMVAQLWRATLARTAIPKDRRSAFMVVIDEMQDFLHLPVDVGDMLAQARGLGVGLTLAHQHLGQLPTELKDGVLANARSRIHFGLGIDDARTLARDLEPHLSADDLRGLRRYEIAFRPCIDSQILPPATGMTRDLPPATPGQAERLRNMSRDRWGRDRAEIEEQMRNRRSGGREKRRPGREEVAS